MPLDPTLPLQAQGVPPLVNPLQFQQQIQGLQVQREQAAALEEERAASAQQRQQQADALARQQSAMQSYTAAIQAGKGQREASLAYAYANGDSAAIPLITKYFDDTEKNAADTADLQAKAQQAQQALQSSYQNRLGHAADFVLNYGGNDPQKLQAALAMTTAHYVEDNPQDAAQAQQVFQALRALPPDQLQQRLQMLRSQAPFYQSQQAELQKPFNLTPGESRVAGNGQVIATAGPAPITPYQQQDLALRQQQLVQQRQLEQQKMAQTERLQNPLAAALGPAVTPTAAGTTAPGQASVAGGVTPPLTQGTANLANLHGDALLQAIGAQNPQIANQVKALAEGRQQFPSSFALKYPYWQQMLGLVAQYDPSFDATNYSQRAQMRKDFTTGKSAQTINALNTVAQHLNQLSTASTALNNGNVTLWNSLANTLSKATGNPAVTNFDAVKTAVTDELTRVWRQSGGSEQDIKNWAASLNSSESPEQLKQAIAQISELLGGKLSAMQNQLGQAMGPTTDIRVITPETQQILGTLSGKTVGKSDPLGIR